MSEGKRKRAADTLIWYFRKLFKQAGIPWESVNDAEMRGVVEDIIESAINEPVSGR